MSFLLATLYGAVFLQIYHFLLYPAAVWMLSRLRPSRAAGARTEGFSVSVIICAFNERGIMGDKIRNTRALDPAPFEILVAADGSTDGTDLAAREAGAGDVPVRVLFEPARRGKSAAMNRGAARARGDILCFTDANAFLSPDALGHLVAPFADPSVAVASGAKHVTDDEAAGPVGLAHADGLYWKYESLIRESESRLGATVASVGELIAVRRRDWTAIPDGVVNDDAWITMHALARGRNARYARRAESRETASADSAAEAARRRRINAGRVTLLMRRDVWPLRRPFVLLAFLSHKVLRLALPFLFAIGLLASLLLVAMGAGLASMPGLLLAAHLLVLALATVGAGGKDGGKLRKLAAIAHHVLSSYLAAAFGVWDALAGRKHVLWEKADR